jgi:NADP-dependent 3-hydroxy acid dehydrogenase YdfG
MRPAVITGASSGIGEAAARSLAALGHPVVLGARRIEACERIAAEIASAGGCAHAAHLDLADEASVTAFAKAAEAAVGAIDVLVSNAGLVQPSEVLTASRADFDRHLAVNTLGVHSLVQAIAVGMAERRRGDLVFVTSEVLRAPRPGIAAYVTSKFAAEGMIAALAMELEGTGVRVATVRPGATFTGMGMDWDPVVTGAIYQDWKRRGLQLHDQLMTPADVAAAILAVVAAPPGVVFRSIEVEPLSPVEDRPATQKEDGR